MPSEVSTIGGDQSGEKLRRELAEAREQQAATAEILAAISNSLTDPSRVFAEIAASAARLCDAYNAAILRVVSDHLLVLAVHGPLLHIGSVGQGKIPLKRGILVARVVINRLPPSFRASNTCVECAGARALFAVTGWVSLVVRRLRWRAILSIGGRNGNGG